MTVNEEQIAHLRGCLDRSIGPEATSTVMTMLTAVDMSNVATKDDIRALKDEIRALGDRMDHRFEMVDLTFEAMDRKFTDRMNAMDEKFTERLNDIDRRFTERLNALDEKFTERISALDQKFSERIEGVRHGMEANMYRAINRHLTFSVMAMATVSGMFTWLAR